MFTVKLYLNSVRAFRRTSMDNITLHTRVYVYSVSVYSCVSVAECIRLRLSNLKRSRRKEGMKRVKEGKCGEERTLQSNDFTLIFCYFLMS